MRDIGLVDEGGFVPVGILVLHGTGHRVRYGSIVSSVERPQPYSQTNNKYVLRTSNKKRSRVASIVTKRLFSASRNNAKDTTRLLLYLQFVSPATGLG